MNQINNPPDNTGENRDNRGRFLSGTSGNPNGRPKGSVSITDGIKQKLEEIPEGKDKTYLEIFITQILDRAIKGDHQLIKQIWDHIDGRAREAIEVNDNRPLPIPILTNLFVHEETEENNPKINN